MARAADTRAHSAKPHTAKPQAAKPLWNENGITITPRLLLLPNGEHELSNVSELVASWRHRGWLLVAMGLCLVATFLIENKGIPIVILLGFGCFYFGIGFPHRLYFRTHAGETVVIASGDIEKLTKIERVMRRALENLANDNAAPATQLTPLEMRVSDDHFESAEPVARQNGPNQRIARRADVEKSDARAERGGNTAKPSPIFADDDDTPAETQHEAPDHMAVEQETVLPDEPDAIVEISPAEQAKAEAEAIETLRGLAAGGETDAQAELGMILLKRRNAARDAGEAAFWLRKAASGGHARASAELGILFAKGEGGMPADPEAAERCWRRAAENGDSYALALLGEFFDSRGDDDQRAEAGQLLEKAAAAQEPLALYRLGVRAETGVCGPVDPPAALRWYRKAGSLGDAPALFAAARLLGHGPTALRNEAEAAECYLGAAKLGHALAQAEIGRCFADGTGVKANALEAWYWLDRAVRAGLHHAAARRDALAQSLDDAECDTLRRRRDAA